VRGASKNALLTAHAICKRDRQKTIRRPLEMLVVEPTSSFLLRTTTQTQLKQGNGQPRYVSRPRMPPQSEAAGRTTTVLSTTGKQFDQQVARSRDRTWRCLGRPFGTPNTLPASETHKNVKHLLDQEGHEARTWFSFPHTRTQSTLTDRPHQQCDRGVEVRSSGVKGRT
jgi:hypothetical protein